MRHVRGPWFATVLCLLFLLQSSNLYPCTIFLLPHSPDQVVAVDVDWWSSGGLVFINKRNILKQSAFVDSSQTPLQWTSKYMSITFSAIGLDFPWGGMNEAGLSAEVLAAYPQLPPVDSRPAVNGIQWAQYILDTSASVAEAVQNAELVRVTGPFAGQQHYFVCDATGACAAFDYLSGWLVIKTGPALSYPALANDPYPQERQNLNSLLSSNTPAQILAIPATDTGSLIRFAKAALLATEYSPQQEEIGYAFSTLNAVSDSLTQWRIAFSLANQSLQYYSRMAPGLKYIDLRQFDPGCTSGVQFSHLNARTSGDVTSQFSAYSESVNDEQVSTNTNYDAGTLTTLQNYPATTQCTETTTTFTSSANPASQGSAVTVSAVVTGHGSTPPTGTVTFMSGATVLGTTNVDSAGTAQLSVNSLSAGSDELIAVYNGDSSDMTSTSPPLWQGVNVSLSQTTLSSSQNPANVGGAVTVSATVTGKGVGKPTGSVALWDGNSMLTTATLNSQGVADFPLTLSAGSHSLTAVYSGDAANASSSATTLVQTVNTQPTQTALSSGLNPSELGQPVPFTAAVTGEYAAQATGTVTLRINGNVVPPIVRLQTGHGSLTRNFVLSGARSVTATYSGDINSLPSTSSSLTQQVYMEPSQINLATSANSYTIGESVNITATVTGQYGGTPAGTVTFTINGNAVTLSLSGGQAMYSTSFAQPGTEIASATYSGDGNYSPSTTSSSISIPVIQGQATQTNLITSQNPATAGQSVTYTATVTGQGVPPGGTVTFFVNGTSAATSPVNGGQASYTRTFGAAGSRNITATYSGDGTNQPSTSSSLLQVVN